VSIKLNGVVMNNIFWNELSKEDQQKCFISVCNLIKDNIITNQVSYYKFLEDVLKFELTEELHNSYEDIHFLIVARLEDIQDRII
jgi:hypothetical protein